MERTVFEIIRQRGIIPGMVVMSLKGHDTGRVYLVIRNEGRFVWLADGRLRKIDNMKKKRVSHVKPLGQAADENVHDMITTGTEANPKIRELIKDFLIDNQ